MSRDTTRDDLTRHREWLSNQMAVPQDTMSVYKGTDQPTYVIRVSAENRSLRTEVAWTLRGLTDGADIVSGKGIWENSVEDSVTITSQTDQPDDILSRLAKVSGIRWAHVERHTPETAYVDLDDWR